MSLNILQAGPDHLGQIVPLFDAYRQFYEQPSDTQGARRFLHDRLVNGESVIFLALLDGEAAGFIQLYPSFSSVSMKRRWILNDLFVTPEARRKGVGEAMLERARLYAVETGAKGLMLETAVDNIPAQRLYESLGWQRETEFYVYNLRV
jgi:GNAT superfamily N-acetyltransferase